MDFFPELFFTFAALLTPALAEVAFLVDDFPEAFLDEEFLLGAFLAVAFEAAARFELVTSFYFSASTSLARRSRSS